MYYDNVPFGDLEGRRSRVEAQRENTARLAKAYARWTTKGVGEIIVDKPFKFNVSFLERPSFNYGTTLDEDDDLVSGFYPRVHAGVYDWVRLNPPGNIDGDGSLEPFYIGAYVYFVVDTIGNGAPYNAAQPLYTIHHNLTWEGTALKDLPAHLLDF